MAGNPFRDGNVCPFCDLVHSQHIPLQCYIRCVEEPRTRFIGYINKAIQLHPGFIIKHFRLSFDYYHNFWDVSVVDGWVSFLLTRNIQELVLEFGEKQLLNLYTTDGLSVIRISPTPLYAFPCQAFAPNMLTLMSLHCCRFRASNLGSFESLKILYLGNVELQDTKITHLLSKFPVLDDLLLRECAFGEDFFVSEEVLTIEYLYINDCFTTMWKVFPVNITAPNLSTFHFYGAYLQDFSIKEANNLTTMEIAIIFPMADPLQENFLSSLLNCLDHCKNLELSSWCNQVLSMRQANPEELLQLQSITDLTLHVYLITGELPGISCLLRSCSKLETLTLDIQMVDEPESCNVFWIGFVPDVFNFEEDEYWQSQELPIKCLQHSLKTLHIYGFTGRITEVETLKFLLQKSAILETLYIYNPDSWINNPGDEGWVTRITDIYNDHIKNVIQFAAEGVEVVIG